MNSQLDERDAFESQTDNGALCCVLVTLVPETSFGAQHFGMLGSEAIEAGTSQAVFAFDDKSQTHRQLAVGFLISLGRGQSRQQVSFAVGGAARINFAVNDAGGKWTKRP